MVGSRSDPPDGGDLRVPASCFSSSLSRCSLVILRRRIGQVAAPRRSHRSDALGDDSPLRTRGGLSGSDGGLRDGAVGPRVRETQAPLTQLLPAAMAPALISAAFGPAPPSSPNRPSLPRSRHARASPLLGEDGGDGIRDSGRLVAHRGAGRAIAIVVLGFNLARKGFA